jgi:hypothetical protein
MREKIQITISINELEFLQDIMCHFTDFMIRDIRPENGLLKLREYRYLSGNDRLTISLLAVKLKLAYSNERKYIRKRKQVRRSLSTSIKMDYDKC